MEGSNCDSNGGCNSTIFSTFGLIILIGKSGGMLMVFIIIIKDPLLEGAYVDDVSIIYGSNINMFGHM